MNAVMRHYAVACHPWQLPVLLDSMRRHCRPFQLHVLAWDFDPPHPVHYWPEVAFTTRAAFASRHPGATALPGPARNGNETVCSLRWTFLCDVMEQTGRPVTLVDGDSWFFSSPEPVYEEIGSAPCAVTPHGFPPAARGLPGVALETHRRYGLYNGGWVYFADPVPARFQARLAWEWCYLGFREMADGRSFFGDQSYLELLVEGHGAHVVQHPGVNLGPWGIHAHPMELVGGQVHFGGRPLVSYHYSSFGIGPGGVRWGHGEYELNLRQLELVYYPYLQAVRSLSGA